jgi:tetratricopeptide (TPR) repeat protein
LAAVEHQKAGRWPEAAQGYARVTAQAPDFAAGWKQLATARFHMGDFEGAVASADRYLALQPQDEAFAAWSDQMRTRLKLPPRVTPAPTPGPPTPSPVPTPEGLLMQPPPPGIDAVTVPIEAATALNAEAMADIAELEEQEARRSRAQMADEAAAILRQREPARGSARVGLRLLGGLALGLGRFEHGEAVDSATTPSPARHNGAPAGGGAGVAELSLGFGERLELGLGAFPILWHDSRKSIQTDTVSRSNSSEAGAAFVPLLASLTWRWPLQGGVSLLLGGGAGVIPSAQVRVKSETAQTHASGVDVTQVDARLDYGLAPAWRVMAGAAWALGPKLSFELAAQMLGASFADAGGSAKLEQRDETGAVLLSMDGVPVSPQPLQVLSLNLLAGLNWRF